MTLKYTNLKELNERASLDVRLSELSALLPLTNADREGVDSTKRKLAIELLAGPADGEQTNRLARLALCIAAQGHPRELNTL